MAENWYKLGFIVQRASSGPDPIFFERQRGQKKCICPDSPEEKLPIPKGGDLQIPTWDIPTVTFNDGLFYALRDVLRNLLQEAMGIELATIPLYLFGMYNIKIPAQYANDPRYNAPVSAIRSLYSVFFVLRS